MLSALDRLGLPVATQVVSGERADDQLYLPTIAQVRKTLNAHGLLYVGDCKMAALDTRASLAGQQDYYLCPLAAKQMPEEVLDESLQSVWTGEQALIAVWREREVGKPEQMAQGYERSVTLSRDVAAKTISWTERQLIVRSFKLAQASTQGLHARLAKAQAELGVLNEHKQGKKRYADGAALQQAAQAILKQHRVDGLLQVRIEEQVQERAVRRLGWRVYVTNHPTEGLSLEQAVLAYREEYLVEPGVGRVIGKPLSLSPMYVQRATGLVRLLSIGLRILTRLQFQVRHHLADQQEPLAGLYAGNPKRTTQRPTAEALLGAFHGLHLSIVTLGPQLHRHLTPLSALQQRILSLLDFSSNLYDQLLC